MTRTDRYPLVFMILVSFTPILSIHLPRFLAFWPLIIGLVFTLWAVLGRKEALNLPKPYYVCVGIISALCIASSAWSISPADTFEDAITTSILLMFGGLFLRTCSQISVESIKPYLWFFPIATVIAALLCAFDLAFDMPLYHILHGKTELDKINTSVMNRGIVCTVIAYFLSLLFLASNEHSTKMSVRIGFGLFMTACVLTALNLSQSQSGQLIFILGLIILFAFPSKFKVSYYVLAGGICAGMLLTPLIAPWLFTALMDYAHATPWLFDAYVGNRTEIWDFVIKYAMQNPLYGFGMEATKYVPEFEHGYVFHTEKTILHPHNFAVQIWIEFGLLGTLIMASILAYLIQTIGNLDSSFAKRVSTTVFIMTLLFASMTYGLWQGWWVGEMVFILSLCAFFTKNSSQAHLVQKY